MAKLVDTTEWREFRVGDLFGKCELKWHGDHEFSKTLDVSDTPDDEFNLPLVNAKLGGNGIMFYGREFEWDSVEMSIDIISNGASAVGSVYAQPQKTGVLWDAYLVKCRDDIRTGTLQFLATVMESQIKQHFSYDNKCTWNKVKLLSVNLPATPDGKPDWDYMEQYMTQVMDEMRPVAEELHQLESTLSLHAVDVSEWKEFRVGELFEVKHGSRLNKADRIDGEIPFVTAGFENRGVAQYIGNDVELYRNPITVDMFGNSFYQAGEVSGDDNVYFFVNDDVSGALKQFIATSITAVCAGRFDYGRQFRQGDADALSIKLPATPDGKPDWEAMAEMMRGYMDSVRDVAHVIAELG